MSTTLKVRVTGQSYWRIFHDLRAEAVVFGWTADDGTDRHQLK